MGNLQGRWGTGLLIAALASSLMLCIPALRGQPLALDEQVSFYTSGAPSLGELWERCDKVAVLPPLSHLFERAALAAGGHSETVLRLPSLLAYGLAIVASWWLGRIVGGPLCGGLTALIVAWHPGVLDEVRFARCYGLVLLLAALSTGLVLHWRTSPARAWRLAAWAGVATALVWTHYLAAPLVAVQCLLVVITVAMVQRSHDSTLSWIAFGALVGIAFGCFPLVPAVFRLSDWSRLIDYQRFPATTLQAMGGGWTLLAFVAVFGSLAFGKVMAGRPGNVLPPPNSQRPALGVMLALWLLPLAAIALLALTSNPMLASPRYRVMVAPASAVAVALTLARAYPPALATSATAAMLFAATLLQGTTPWKPARLQNPIEAEWKRIGLELAPRLADPTAVVLTQSGLAEGILLPMLPDNDRFRKYVACRLGPFYTGSDQALPIPILWDGYGPLQRVYLSRLESPTTRDVWIAGASDTDLNRASVQMFASFLQSSGFRLFTSEERPGLTVLHFQRGDPQN